MCYLHTFAKIKHCLLNPVYFTFNIFYNDNIEYRNNILSLTLNNKADKIFRSSISRIWQNMKIYGK